ncbi:MAG: universal stress protein [Planctomycetota bacterium]|nr:universal stress protein [Planctomycetota bacterium]
MGKSSLVNHILVLVDGTEASFHAADRAIDLARSIGARLTALAVIDRDTLHHLLSAKILVDVELSEFEKELESSARRHLDVVRQKAQEHHIEVDEVLATGNVGEIVPKEVHARGVDLICMGGFHSTRVSRDLLARQRQQVIDRAACAVLIGK